jgi:hypothetical protein
LLNEHPSNYELITERHNRVVKVVKEAVLKFVDENLRLDIHENTTIRQEGLPDGLKSLRPDMVFEREGRAGRVMEILKFSCPYGYVSHERDTLATVCEQKKAKYSDLASALRKLRQQPVNVTAIIVSSMGAVSSQLLKELRKILGYSSREMQKLGKRMSDAAITGSFKIWRKCAQRTERGPIGEGEEGVIIEQERREAMEAGENERAGEVGKIERSEVSLEASRAAGAGGRDEGRPHGGNERPVEAEEERQGNDGGPDAQQRVMTVGEVGQGHG